VKNYRFPVYVKLVEEVDVISNDGARFHRPVIVIPRHRRRQRIAVVWEVIFVVGRERCGGVKTSDTEFIIEGDTHALKTAEVVRPRHRGLNDVKRRYVYYQ
jgi:hypothetical protein